MISLEWSQIDFILYNETFASRARVMHAAGTATVTFIHQHTGPGADYANPAPHGGERGRFKVLHHACELYKSPNWELVPLLTM